MLQSLALLAASLKRVPVDDMPRLGKQLEDACIAQSHRFSLQEGYEVVNNLQRYVLSLRADASTHAFTTQA